MKLPFDKIVPICISAYGYYIKALSYYLHTGFRRFPYYISIFTNIEYVELGNYTRLHHRILPAEYKKLHYSLSRRIYVMDINLDTSDIIMYYNLIIERKTYKYSICMHYHK